MRPLEKEHPQGASTEHRAPKQRSEALRLALSLCSPFAVLDEGALEQLGEVCVFAKFARRSLLYQEGSSAECIYVVAVGRVRVVRAAGVSRVLTVAYRAPAELLGECALPDGQSYRDAASATESVEAVRVPLHEVQTLLKHNPAFSNKMLGLMVDRRLEAERRVESLLSRSVESRVAEFLVDAVGRNGVEDERGVLIGARYTHQEIADYVGSTRETVTLTLGELRRQELLSFDHRRIVITKLDALTKIA